jgi:hypothetical protein
MWAVELDGSKARRAAAEDPGKLENPTEALTAAAFTGAPVGPRRLGCPENAGIAGPGWVGLLSWTKGNPKRLLEGCCWHHLASDRQRAAPCHYPLPDLDAYFALGLIASFIHVPRQSSRSHIYCNHNSFVTAMRSMMAK